MRSWVAAIVLILVCHASQSAFADSATAADASLNCVILPDEQVDISSPVPGVIKEVAVERSHRVRSGQVVARLESTVEAATVVLARARADTDAEIQLRRVELEYDAQHRDRLQTLQVRQATSSQSLDDAERIAEAARLRVRLAEDRKREAVLERRRADALLALKTVRSPIDGVVVQQLKTVGEYVEAHPILRVARLDPLKIEVITPLSLFGEIQEGMQMAIRPETDPDRERIATVVAVDAVADPGSGTFGIELELPNPDMELPPGIKCKGRLLPQVAETAAEASRSDTDLTVESSISTPRPQVQDGAGADSAALAHSNLAVHVTDPAGEEPGACLAYEPLDDESLVNALAEAAKQIGGRAQRSEVSETREVGYLVVTPADPRPESRDALAIRLEKAGVSDMAFIDRGTYANRIALGAYNGPLSAQRRRATLARLGFDTEVHSRTRTHRAWRVQVVLPQGLNSDTAREILSRNIGKTIPATDSCDLVRTAAR